MHGLQAGARSGARTGSVMSRPPMPLADSAMRAGLRCISTSTLLLTAPHSMSSMTSFIIAPARRGQRVSLTGPRASMRYAEPCAVRAQTARESCLLALCRRCAPRTASSGRTLHNEVGVWRLPVVLQIARRGVDLHAVDAGIGAQQPVRSLLRHPAAFHKLQRPAASCEQALQAWWGAQAYSQMSSWLTPG